MRDDHEFNIKFVTLVEVHPCIYDKTREDYHMSNVQERAWAKIAKDIGGATIADCKKRWKNLRGSYTKHLKAYVPSGSGASVKRAYYLSKYINFILPFTKSRQPKGNVESQKNTKTADIVVKEEIFTEELETEEQEQLESQNAHSWQLQKQPREKNHSDADDEQSIIIIEDGNNFFLYNA